MLLTQSLISFSYLTNYLFINVNNSGGHTMHFTEDMFEQAVIELLENMGYTHIYAPDMERDYSSPLLDSVLMDSLVKLNKGLPLDAINDAMAKLRDFDTGSLLQKNMQFMDYLQNGVPVRYFVKGEERTSLVYLIDYKNVEKCFVLIEKELDKLKNTKLGTLQLYRARKQLIGQMAITYDANLTEMLSIGKNHLIFNEVEPINKICKKIETITAEELINLANEIFNNQNISKLIIGK